MKTNKFMRLASILLVLTLLTTCGISGTFAKYVTSGNATDSARVAKWGVSIQAGGSLYDTDYYKASSTAAAQDNTDVISVAAATKVDASRDNVLAPGTKSADGLKFSVEGTPEVSSQVNVKITTRNIFLKKGVYGVMLPAEGITAENFKENTYYTLESNKYVLARTYSDTLYVMSDKVDVTDDYYPVIYSLAGSGVTYSSGTTASDSLLAIADTIAKKVDSNATVSIAGSASNYMVSVYENTSATFAPNTDLTTDAALNLDDCVLSWAWAFENQNDGADTILGNLMSGIGIVVKQTADTTGFVTLEKYSDYCPDTQFGIEIGVTQVD